MSILPFVIGQIVCSGSHFPTDTQLVISQKLNRNLYVVLGHGKAKLKYFDVFPPSDGDMSVARLYQADGGYNVRFGYEYMCRRAGQTSVVPCRGEKNDDDAIWSISSTPKGTVFKHKGRCLTMGHSDIEDESFALFVKKCINDETQIFEIREVPILPLDWSSYSEETSDM